MSSATKHLPDRWRIAQERLLASRRLGGSRHDRALRGSRSDSNGRHAADGRVDQRQTAGADGRQHRRQRRRRTVGRCAEPACNAFGYIGAASRVAHTNGELTRGTTRVGDRGAGASSCRMTAMRCSRRASVARVPRQIHVLGPATQLGLVVGRTLGEAVLLVRKEIAIGCNGFADADERSAIVVACQIPRCAILPACVERSVPRVPVGNIGGCVGGISAVRRSDVGRAIEPTFRRCSGTAAAARAAAAACAAVLACAAARARGARGAASSSGASSTCGATLAASASCARAAARAGGATGRGAVFARAGAAIGRRPGHPPVPAPPPFAEPPDPPVPPVPEPDEPPVPPPLSSSPHPPISAAMRRSKRHKPEKLLRPYAFSSPFGAPGPKGRRSPFQFVVEPRANRTCRAKPWRPGEIPG